MSEEVPDAVGISQLTKSESVIHYEAALFDGQKYTVGDNLELCAGPGELPFVGTVDRIFEHPGEPLLMLIRWFYRWQDVECEVPAEIQGPLSDRELLVSFHRDENEFGTVERSFPLTYIRPDEPPPHRGAFVRYLYDHERNVIIPLDEDVLGFFPRRNDCLHHLHLILQKNGTLHRQAKRAVPPPVVAPSKRRVVTRVGSDKGEEEEDDDFMDTSMPIHRSPSPTPSPPRTRRTAPSSPLLSLSDGEEEEEEEEELLAPPRKRRKKSVPAPKRKKEEKQKTVRSKSVGRRMKVVTPPSPSPIKVTAGKGRTKPVSLKVSSQSTKASNLPPMMDESESLNAPQMKKLKALATQHVNTIFKDNECTWSNAADEVKEKLALKIREQTGFPKKVIYRQLRICVNRMYDQSQKGGDSEDDLWKKRPTPLDQPISSPPRIASPPRSSYSSFNSSSSSRSQDRTPPPPPSSFSSRDEFSSSTSYLEPEPEPFDTTGSMMNYQPPSPPPPPRPVHHAPPPRPSQHSSYTPAPRPSRSHSRPRSTPHSVPAPHHSNPPSEPSSSFSSSSSRYHSRTPPSHSPRPGIFDFSLDMNHSLSTPLADPLGTSSLSGDGLLPRTSLQPLEEPQIMSSHSTSHRSDPRTNVFGNQFADHSFLDPLAPLSEPALPLLNSIFDQLYQTISDHPDLTRPHEDPRTRERDRHAPRHDPRERDRYYDSYRDVRHDPRERDRPNDPRIRRQDSPPRRPSYDDRPPPSRYDSRPSYPPREEREYDRRASEYGRRSPPSSVSSSRSIPPSSGGRHGWGPTSHQPPSRDEPHAWETRDGASHAPRPQDPSERVIVDFSAFQHLEERTPPEMTEKKTACFQELEQYLKHAEKIGTTQPKPSQVKSNTTKWEHCAQFASLEDFLMQAERERHCVILGDIHTSECWIGTPALVHSTKQVNDLSTFELMEELILTRNQIDIFSRIRPLGDMNGFWVRVPVCQHGSHKQYVIGRIVDAFEEDRQIHLLLQLPTVTKNELFAQSHVSNGRLLQEEFQKWKHAVAQAGHFIERRERARVMQKREWKI